MPSLVPPAVELKPDGLEDYRAALRYVTELCGDWAGIPMFVPDLPLEIEETYRYAEMIDELQAATRAKTADSSYESNDSLLKRAYAAEHTELELRNQFWSWRKRCWISVWEFDGKIFHTKGSRSHVEMLMQTIFASVVWGVEEENMAVQRLSKLLPYRHFKCYLLTGMFFENSKRSGVLYIFRRLRPTIAVRDNRILCTLCMHPVGYYKDSWGGVMPPTDDVIAALLMMRGDEHMFWRRSNQHPPEVIQSGI